MTTCKYCGRRIIGGKGDYWHWNEEINMPGNMACEVGFPQIATPVEISDDEMEE